MFRNQATIYNKIIIGLLTLMLVACGGNDSSNGQTDDVTTNRPAVATMPIPDFQKSHKQWNLSQIQSLKTAAQTWHWANGSMEITVQNVMGQRVRVVMPRH